jgi:restriction system protein
MAYRSRKSGRGSAIVIVIVATGAMLYSQGWSSSAIFNTIAIGLLAALAVWIFYRPIIGAFRWVFRSISRLMQKQKIKRITRSTLSIDEMTWEEFEYFVADWLRDRGYTNVRLTEHYDLGVDIVAKKDGITWGVQVKHYHGLVGINAVRQVVVALKKYKCDRAMVVTNSVFSRPAIEIAKSQDCVLVDGSKL